MYMSVTDVLIYIDNLITAFTGVFCLFTSTTSIF